MTEGIDSLILEHLRAIRADVQGLKRDNQDIKMGLSVIESHVATSHMEGARHNSKFDEIDERIDKIEKRLELSGAQPA
jgi:hypothetical protein